MEQIHDEYLEGTTLIILGELGNPFIIWLDLGEMWSEVIYTFLL